MCISPIIFNIFLSVDVDFTDVFGAAKDVLEIRASINVRAKKAYVFDFMMVFPSGEVI